MIVTPFADHLIVFVLGAALIWIAGRFGRSLARYHDWKDEHGEAWKAWKASQKGGRR